MDNNLSELRTTKFLNLLSTNQNDLRTVTDELTLIEKFTNQVVDSAAEGKQSATRLLSDLDSVTSNINGNSAKNRRGSDNGLPPFRGKLTTRPIRISHRKHKKKKPQQSAT